MATTTASLTISSSDISSDAISVSVSETFYKAGTTIGLDQTTGMAKIDCGGTAFSNKNIALASAYSGSKNHKLFVRNPGTSTTNYVVVEVGASNIVLGRLYGGEFLLIPWAGDQDIDVSTSATNMSVEYMIISEA
tara:strand:+ start:2176 stop:2580 length:405 start_codon:yes stop_codon:yes gene_type:complete